MALRVAGNSSGRRRSRGQGDGLQATRGRCLFPPVATRTLPAHQLAQSLATPLSRGGVCTRSLLGLERPQLQGLFQEHGRHAGREPKLHGEATCTCSGAGRSQGKTPRQVSRGRKASRWPLSQPPSDCKGVFQNCMESCSGVSQWGKPGPGPIPRGGAGSHRGHGGVQVPTLPRRKLG